MFLCEKSASNDKTAEITAVLISSCASAVAVRYNCDNSTVSLVSLVCVRRRSCLVVRFVFEWDVL
jgi:hypothetical protein